MSRSQSQLLEQFNEIREQARQALFPLKPAGNNTKADDKFLFTAKRTKAGQNLPPYYLVYFLLIDLLGYRNLGRFEKVAWSIPVDLDGTAFLIEYRKFGLGVFAHDPETEEQQAQRIVRLIQKAVKVAKPYFKWVADKAVHESKLNVVNNSFRLFQRYVYFRDSSKSMFTEAEIRKKERVVTERKTTYGISTTIHYPAFELLRNSRYLALAAIDAFFAWTEHIFIHIAILKGKVTTGTEVAQLACADWSVKFKTALGINDISTKIYFDKLLVIRRQLRNFMAHGAFGKEGEAFSFHSTAGAVPVVFGQATTKQTFSLAPESPFDNSEAVKIIEQFITHMWSGPEGPARIYLHDWELPTILTMARDGSYIKAMSSIDKMSEFAEYLGHQMERAADMDY